MNTITTAATTYTPPSTSVVHNAQVSLTDRSPASVVHLVQYDDTLPIVAVALTANGQAYTVPAGAAVNVRMAKPDGTYVYNPALGVSENAQTAYIAVTLQMAAKNGKASPIIEIVVDGNVAATGTFTMIIDENPVPESAIESTDEFLTIQQLAAQVQQAADLVEQNAQNIQDVVDNMDAIQNAAANAQAAAESAAQAAQSAQQALGFRTFFDAISPDANGSLDPSRPMTTAAAQASWTVKSKGDRIQSAQVNGFTADGQSAGLQLYRLVITGTEAWQMATTITPGIYRAIIPATNLPVQPKPPRTTSDIANVLSTLYKPVAAGASFALASGVSITTDGSIYVFDPSFSTSNVDTWKQHLQNLYEAGTPLIILYEPADASQATGLYIPIQAQGHEYRCQMLELTEALGAGDNVQSCVPSEFDSVVVFDGSPDENWAVVGANGSYQTLAGFFPTPVNDNTPANIMSNYLPVVSGNSTYIGTVGVSVNTLGRLAIRLPDGADPASYLQAHPLKVLYRSAAYSEQNDIPVSLETHANGNVYAHDAVTLVAVPYTDADVAAANQLASTPSTLPNIDSPDIPMLLDAAEPEQVAPATLAANAILVAGTYVVSSQDGTTVLVSLKAFQDGGDAATLGGQTLEQLNNTYLTQEQLLTLIYPVGSIYMSANNVSPQTFLGGTWTAIEGQFLLAASSTYPAGSTGGEATHTLTTEEAPALYNVKYGSASGGSGPCISGAAIFTDGLYSDTVNNTPLNDGGGQPHNNMPPYLAVYMWQRTA